MSLPKTKYIGNEQYALVVFVIDSERPNGTLNQLRLIRDEDIVKLSQDGTDNKFMTGYVPAKML